MPDAEDMGTDQGLFLAIFDQHAEAIHRYLARRVGTITADELLTEVWIRAFSSRHSFVGTWLECLPWLYGVARNTLYGHWAQQRRRRIDAARDSVTSVDPWEDVDDRLQAEAVGPALRAAIAALSETEREVLLLVAWERLTPKEVAVVLGIPAPTVRTRLRRARARVARALRAPGHSAISWMTPVPMVAVLPPSSHQGGKP